MMSHKLIRILFPLLLLANGLFCNDMYQTPPSSSPEPPGKLPDVSFPQITPNAGPRVNNGIDVFITADFIYWTARIDGLGYAISGQASLLDPFGFVA